MMTFAEYIVAMNSKKRGIAVDDEEITRFVSRQPASCQVCGVQVFDPFGMGVVIHDVDRCSNMRANAKDQATPSNWHITPSSNQ